MAVQGGAGHGKSWAPLARGCFLLVSMLLLLLLDEAHALTARHPALTLGNNNVKFRGVRSALMHPTAIVLSPPIESPGRQQEPLKHLGSSSSSFLSPGVVSRAPSTRGQLDTYSRSVAASLATPAITPAPHTPQPHPRGTGGGSYPPQPTVTGFGLDSGTRLKWMRPRPSHTFTEGGGGRRGMNAPTIHTSRGWPPPRTQHTPDTADSTSPFDRHDTFGFKLSEDLSHRHDGQKVSEAESPVGGRGRAGRRGPGTVFHGGSRQTHLWSIEKEIEEGKEDGEGGRSMFDSNATSEYQPDDYSAYHEYDHSNTSWRPSEHTPSPVHNQGILTLQHVMEIQNLASQTDLHALLDQRGITVDDLQDFLNSGAQKKDVLEFLKAPTPSTTIITTTTSPPVLSHPPSSHGVSLVEEGYQDDVTRQASIPATKTESGDEDTDLESKEQSRKNRKKGRGKGGRRKNRRRNGKKVQRKGTSDVSASSPSPQVTNTTQIPNLDPWVSSTPKILPEIPSSTTTTTITTIRDILLLYTQPPTPDTLATSPSSVRTSNVSIVSVTLVEAPSDPQPETPGQTTFVEGSTPPKRQSTHSTTNLWEERNSKKTLRPAKPSAKPEQTINEIEEVSFVREKQRDDYVFPLRGLLIISGLMGALAVFTLVVLISYAVIKCSKKPVVNNYQVSEQQKPAGT